MPTGDGSPTTSRRTQRSHNPPNEQSTPDTLHRARSTSEFYPIHLDAPGLRTCGEPLDQTKRRRPGQDQWETPHRSARVHTEESRAPLLKARERKREQKHCAEVTPSAKRPSPDRTKQNHKTEQELNKKNPRSAVHRQGSEQRRQSFDNSRVQRRPTGT